MDLKNLIEEIVLELLNEVKLEDVMQQFNSKKMKKAAARNERWTPEKVERWLKTPRFQELFLNFIPEDIEDNDRAEGLQWILGLYKKDKLGSIRRWTKDLVNKHKSNLELFFQQKRFMEQKQLQKLDLESLGDVVDNARPKIKAHLEKKSYLDAEQGKKVILDNENWTIYIPTNKGAACELGKGTEWCTAAPGLNYYEQYHTDKDPLIIFIPKKPSYKGEKYQIHFGSNQFMNEKDEEISKIEKSKLISLLNLILKVKYEKLENGGEYVEALDGTKRWFLNDKLHREDGPAVEYPDGSKEWYLNGELHRKDGPAYESSDGKKVWYLKGRAHREDGPAVEHPDGTERWYLNGKEVSQQEFEKLTKQKNIFQRIKKLIEQDLEETIKKIDDEYVVYPKKGGKRLGAHKTKKAAKKQLAAIEISKAKRGK